MSLHKLTICPNCNYSFKEKENFCPRCGQENHNLNIPIGHLIYEGVEGVFHFDTKFFRTAKLLFLKPGILSKEFNEGKRVRFVPPFRLYIFISFLFFFLLSIYTHPDEGLLITKKTIDTKYYESERGEPFILDFSNKEYELSTTMTNQKLDSLLVSKKHNPSAINRFIVRSMAKVIKMSKEQFVHKLIKNISISMFILMPFFAFLLMLVYFRKKKFYFELLIFSIHLHSFVFLFLTIALSIAYFFNISSIAITLLILLAYLFFSLKNFFNQSTGKTALKSLFVTLAYGLSLAIFFLVVVVTSLLF